MQDGSLARAERFESAGQLPSNRYMFLKREREEARRQSEEASLAPRSLDQAVSLKGSCMDMCPAFEREEREYQNNVDPLEMVLPQPAGSSQRRIDHAKAVKAYHRPAAGVQPHSEDIRPPQVLKQTLDYLFQNILASDPNLDHAHPFLRDRTRAIRQDFTIQHEKGLLSIQCNERIARFHIYCLHAMRGKQGYSESQELEQLRKVLQTLTELYDDAQASDLASQLSNEAEFRSYHLLIHLRDPEVLREAELLPPTVFFSPLMQHAFRLHSLAQRNNMPIARGRPANTPACVNGFSRFFKLVQHPSTPFLLACVLQISFHNVREGALKALRTAYRDQHGNLPLETLSRILGCDDLDDCVQVCESFQVEVVYDEQSGQPTEAKLKRSSNFAENSNSQAQSRGSHKLVESKRGSLSVTAIVDSASSSVSGKSQPPFNKLQSLSAAAPSFSPKKPLPVSRPKTIAPKPTAPVTPSAFSAFNSKPSPQPQVPQAHPMQPSFSFNKPPPSQPASPFQAASNPAAAPVSLPSFAPTPQPSTSAQPALPLFSLAPSPQPQSLAQPQPQPVASTSKTPSPPSATKHTRLSNSIGSTSSPKSKANASPKHPPSAPKPKADPAILVGKVAQTLTEEIIDAHLQNDVERIAVDALASFQADLDRQRRQTEDQACQRLADGLLGSMLRECVAEVALGVQTDRCLSRRMFNRWRTARQYRQTQFKRMCEADGTAVRSLAGESSFVSSSMTADRDLESTLQFDLALQKRDAFWHPGSFHASLIHYIQNVFAHASRDKRPRWDVIVSLGEKLEGSTLAAWYGNKLGMPPGETSVRFAELAAVDVCARMVDLHSSFTAATDHLGLILFDLSAEETPSRRQYRLDALSQRALGLSAYNSALLFLAWPRPGETSSACLSRLNATTSLPDTGFSTIAWLVVEPSKIDERFDRALSSLLENVQLNRQSSGALSVKACLSPFVERWIANWQDLVNHPHFSLDHSLELADRALSLLSRLSTRLEESAHSTFSKGLPSLIVPGRLLRDSIRSFVDQAALHHLFDITLVDQGRLNYNLSLLGQAVVRAVIDRSSQRRFDMTPAFGRVVDDLAVEYDETWEELFAQLSQVKKAKKRSSQAVIDLTGDSLKQPKKRTKSQKVDKAPQWLPDNVSTLQSELQAARKLLSEIRTIAIDDSDDDDDD